MGNTPSIFHGVACCIQISLKDIWYAEFPTSKGNIALTLSLFRKYVNLAFAYFPVDLVHAVQSIQTSGSSSEHPSKSSSLKREWIYMVG